MSYRTPSTLLFALAILVAGFTSSPGQTIDPSIDPHDSMKPGAPDVICRMQVSSWTPA